VTGQAEDSRWAALHFSNALSHGSFIVSVLFLADSSTKTYGPIQVLVH